MIKARASGSKVYLYFMKKGRQVRHRIPRNSSFFFFSFLFLFFFNFSRDNNKTLTLPRARKLKTVYNSINIFKELNIFSLF